MTIFKNTPVYIVHYWPGTSGTFIQTLLAMFEQVGNFGRLSKNGNAHGNNIIRINTKITQNLENQSQYLMVEPINPEKPLFIGEHFPLDYENLYCKFPNSKIVMIQYSIEDAILIEANLFYKVYIDSFDNDQNIKHWNEMKDVFFEGIEHPSLVPDNLIQKFIRTNNQVCPYFSETVKVPDEVVKIRFREILTRKDKILNILSNLTLKPVTENISSFYDDYLTKQYQLCKKVNFNI